jgi:hypothetical protein
MESYFGYSLHINHITNEVPVLYILCDILSVVRHKRGREKRRTRKNKEL